MFRRLCGLCLLTCRRLDPVGTYWQTKAEADGQNPIKVKGSPFPAWAMLHEILLHLPLMVYTMQWYHGNS